MPSKRHTFHKWRDGKIVCACGRETLSCWHAAIQELGKHIASSKAEERERA